MTDEAGSDRVGIKIAPEMNFNDIIDANPQETFGYLVEQLNSLKPAYLHIARFGTPVDYPALLRPRFNGPCLVGGGLEKAKAEALLEAGQADATVFGTAFLANPDLVARFRADAPLNTADKKTFYSPTARGYTDYPLMDGSTPE